MSWRLIAVALAACFAVHGGGRAAAQAERATRVAVLVLPTIGVDPEGADALTEVLLGALAARGGTSFVGREEFQARLGTDDAVARDCVSQIACLGRIGVELGVHEIVAATVSRRESTWAFNVNRFDVRDGVVRGRVFREVVGDLGAVADVLLATVPELYVAATPETTPAPPAPSVPEGSIELSVDVQPFEVYLDGSLTATSEEAMAQIRSLAPGAHDVEVRARGFSPWRRRMRVDDGEVTRASVTLTALESDDTATIVTWIGVGATLTTATAAAYFGLRSQRSLTIDADTRRADALASLSDRDDDAALANVLWATTAGLGLGTLAWALWGDSSPSSGTWEGEVSTSSAHVRWRASF